MADASQESRFLDDQSRRDAFARQELQRDFGLELRVPRAIDGAEPPVPSSSRIANRPHVRGT